MLTVLAMLAGAAWAQDGLNAHGFTMAPSEGGTQDLLTTWRPMRQKAGSFGVNGLFEFADSPLVLASGEGDDRVREPLLGKLFALNLGATVAVHERVAIALSAPVYAFTEGSDGTKGPTFGDLRLSVPVGLVVSDSGFGLSLVPFLDLPTGAPARYVGNEGVGGGALLAAGLSGERFSASANVGYLATPKISNENLNGGSKLLLALGGGYDLNDWLAARLEANFTPSLLGNEFAATESPGETLLSFRGRYDSGLSWTLGGAAPFTRGAGAAAFRVFAGVGYAIGKEAAVDSDGDGFADELDACVGEPETINGWKDEDGCPDQLAELKLRLVNEDDEPVPDAVLLVDGQVVVPDAEGYVMRSAIMPGVKVSASASHKWYDDAVLEEMSLEEGLNAPTLKLMYLPGKVRVITKANTGVILDGRVRFEGPVEKEPEMVGPEGNRVFDLRPGKWRVLVSADAFGTERRDLVIVPGETSLVVIEVILFPAKTVVKATEINILEQVNFESDKATILEESKKLLREVGNVMIDNPEILKIEVQGHTDDRGDDEYNRDLSQRRVDAVMQYLVGQGVKPERMVAKGYGETMPAVPNTTSENRAKNRRVQFVILEPVGGVIEKTTIEEGTK